MAIKPIQLYDGDGAGTRPAAPVHSAAIQTALETIGTRLADILTKVRFRPSFDGCIPMPGLYAILSGAGGGKTTLCRELATAIEEAFSAESAPAISFAYRNCGEPEDPATPFDTVFPAITAFLGQRTASGTGGSQLPAILIVDSLSDLAYQEIPRPPRPSVKEIETALTAGADGDEGVQVFAGDKTTMLDLVLSKPNIYMAPNTAALAGGLTGSYFQLLKRLSMACLSRGVYMFTVLNPLSFDDKLRFRDSVAGCVTAALSIDQQSMGLVRCVKPNADGGLFDLKDTVRRSIANDRIAVTSNDVSDMMTAMLKGGV